MAIKANINNAEKEIEQIKNSDEQDIDYVYSRIGDTEVEGELPISIKSIGGNLTDYRVYGQTSRNLFDMKTFAETCNQVYGTVNYINNTLTFTATNGVDAYVNSVYNKGAPFYVGERPSCIDVLPSTTYTISMSSAPKCYISWVNSSYEVVSAYTQIPANQKSYTFTTPSNCTKLLIRLGKEVTNIGDTFTISDIMLNEGSTPLPYEPYGESVGDRTRNLAPNLGRWIDGYLKQSDGTLMNVTSAKEKTSPFIEVNSNDEFTFSYDIGSNEKWAAVAFYDENKNFIFRSVQYTVIPFTFIVNIENAKFIRLSCNTFDSEIYPNLNSGSTALPYEPYGYKVPVTVEGKNLSEVNEFSNSITDTSKTLNIWVQQGKGQSFVYPDQSNMFVIEKPTTITSHITITDDNDSIRIKHNGYTRDIVIDIVHGLSYGVYSVSFNVLDYDQTTVGGIVINNIMVNKGSIALPYEPYYAPVTTPIYLPEPIKMIGDEAEYIDYGEQKQHRVRKNYLQSSDFEAGAIFTGQDWKNLTYQESKTYPGMIDSERVVFDTTRKRSTNLITIIGTYTISIADGWEFGVVMFPNDRNSGDLFIYNTEPVTISNCTFAIQLKKSDLSDISSADISDYKIMLNKGSTALPYEPYIENTDLDVTLPALPTIMGTNTFSVNTLIPPSMYIKDNFDYKKVFTATRIIEGELPLNYRSIEDSDSTLSNYRIYGQTSRNLFDVTAQHTIAYTNCYEYIISGLNPNLNYTCSTNYNQEDHTDASIYFGGSVTRTNGVWQNEPKTYTPNNDGEIIILIRFIQYEESLPIYEAVVSGDIWIMVNEGDSPLPYEPYGESVGDRTGNLFDKNGVWVNGYINDNGELAENNGIATYTEFINVKPDTDYSLICDSSVPEGVRFNFYDSNKNFISHIFRNMGNPTATTPSTCEYITLSVNKNQIRYLMIIEGSTAPTEYEPYGYKVPVTVSDGTDTLTTNLYLPEQIRKVGDEAEYIDYGEQKQHRVRKNLFYITKFINNNTQSTSQGVNFSIIDNEVYANGTSTGLYPQVIEFDYVLTEGETYAATLYIEGEYTGLPYIYCTTTYDSVGNYQKVPPNVRTIFTALPDTRILFVAQGTGKSFNIKYKLLITKATIEDDTYEPYIENTEVDVTLPALPTLPGTNVLSVGTEVQPSKINIKGKIKGKIYGWHVNPDISDSSNAVTYLKDAIGMTPASMGSTTFDYGSWENAFFMPKPCMLKSNGKVDYYLDPNDYTKKLDGTASDISNPNYDGNAMM